MEDSFLAGFGLLTIIFHVLLIIAQWKIFTKAGEAGWKSLIPIYNLYIMYKMVGMSPVLYIILSFVAAFLTEFAQSIETTPQIAMALIGGVILLWVDIIYAKKLSKAFGKGTGFMIGLILLPNIFQMILGFGSAEYEGPTD